uniref:Uncharacterized protein n=1 Tax=Nothoprocta perdicaria TaxID=30464 RepID=A0A8C7EDW5_NOTPE
MRVFFSPCRNLPLRSQSLNLKRQLQRRARSCLREKRGKLMLARKETTLQKTEMPKQTRYKSKAEGFEILFFIKFYNNAEFCFTFF